MPTPDKLLRAFRVSPSDTTAYPDQALAEQTTAQLGTRLKKLQKRIARQAEAMHAEKKQALLVVFQAMDAAGKDSTIKAVFQRCDPAAFHVASFKQPSKEELRHDFLWRCHNKTPQKGQLLVFNRSHYEETLVVRVHPQWLKSQGIEPPVNEDFWQQRFESINAFEQHLHVNGTQVIKFFLNVSREEQIRRFIRRYSLPDKQWKFSINDYAESLYWDDYQAAYRDTLRNTSTEYAPWYVIPADNKKTMRKLVAAIVDAHLQAMSPHYPQLGVFNEKEKSLLTALLKERH
jgi:PPK2 family polyphosphate:nucleotide phosphotransferase